MGIVMIVCLILACAAGVVVSVVNCCRAVKKEYKRMKKNKKSS